MENIGKKQELLLKIIEFSYIEMPKLPYHNFQHAKEIATAVKLIGQGEKISDEDIFLLEVAGYLHDIIYELGALDNEERSATKSREFLKSLGCDPHQVNVICDLILATKVGNKPRNILEEIICDADLSNLGTEEYFKKSEQIRIERGLPDGKEWQETNKNFLMNHEYYTKTAKRIYGPLLEKNKEIFSKKS